MHWNDLGIKPLHWSKWTSWFLFHPDFSRLDRKFCEPTRLSKQQLIWRLNTARMCNTIWKLRRAIEVLLWDKWCTITIFGGQFNGRLFLFSALHFGQLLEVLAQKRCQPTLNQTVTATHRQSLCSFLLLSPLSTKFITIPFESVNHISIRLSRCLWTTSSTSLVHHLRTVRPVDIVHRQGNGAKSEQTTTQPHSMLSVCHVVWAKVVNFYHYRDSRLQNCAYRRTSVW